MDITLENIALCGHERRAASVGVLRADNYKDNDVSINTDEW